MEKFKQEIYTEIKNAQKELKYKNNEQLEVDISHLYYLCDILELDKSQFKKNYYREIFDPSIFKYYHKYIKNLNINSYLIEVYNDFFKDFFSNSQNDIDYIYKTKINNYDSLSLALDFLKNFNIKYYNTLIKLEHNIILLDNNDYKDEEIYGVALGGNSRIVKPKILILDTDDINTCISIAHETSHIYNFFTNHNLTSKQYINKLINCTTEIDSYYTELCFYDFLKNDYKEDIETCFKDFDDYFFDTVDTIKALFSYINTSFFKYMKNYDDYVDVIRDFYGRLVAYLLYNLNDIEKGNYICNKIMTEIHYKDLESILLENGINLKNDNSHEEVFKLIKKHWN